MQIYYTRRWRQKYGRARQKNLSRINFSTIISHHAFSILSVFDARIATQLWKPSSARPILTNRLSVGLDVDNLSHSKEATPRRTDFKMLEDATVYVKCSCFFDGGFPGNFICPTSLGRLNDPSRCFWCRQPRVSSKSVLSLQNCSNVILPSSGRGRPSSRNHINSLLRKESSKFHGISHIFKQKTNLWSSVPHWIPKVIPVGGVFRRVSRTRVIVVVSGIGCPQSDTYIVGWNPRSSRVFPKSSARSTAYCVSSK